MKLTRWLMYLFLLAVIVCGVMFYSWIFKYLITAVIFAYVLNPWVSWLERRCVPRILGIFIVYIFIGVLIAWAALRFLPVIIDEAQGLLAFLQTSKQQGDFTLLKVPFIQNLQQQIDYWNTQVPILNLHVNFIKLINSIGNSMMNIPDFLVNNYQKILQAVSLIATVPLIGFFLLKDNVRLYKDFLKLVPNRYFEIIIIIMHKIDEVIGKYLRALIYEIIIVGSLASVVLSFLGVPYAILIGFFAGVANIIPYFGPWFGALFAVLSILMAGLPPIMMLYAALGMYLVQVVDNNFVYPFVIGTSIDMHPLIVLLTVLAGGWAFGLLGMLVSVPVVYLVYSVTKVLYINMKEFKMI